MALVVYQGPSTTDFILKDGDDNGQDPVSEGKRFVGLVSFPITFTLKCSIQFINDKIYRQIKVQHGKSYIENQNFFPYYLLFFSYLNGLIQTLFMTPEFRNAIFSWNYDKMKEMDIYETECD
jgi:hypothetical protein